MAKKINVVIVDAYAIMYSTLRVWVTEVHYLVVKYLESYVRDS